MKLKSIHIAGFKSFAERVSIHYHAGITGVIGPNGSGKSNIIDAVRWVMGEQTSKSLRAEDPTDIIFSGSQNKKPLSLAEVTLVFSNDGGQCPAEFLHLPEVSIGRSVNRGGERDYFMNREPCRLKDIVDFLFSLGLGSKSYAIIQQDKRDRIIHASPEDLREVLEETAGITLFKIKRKEAEKRLLSTAERLKNLKEIEFELFRQKESLEHQVEKAKQKLSYLEELKETEISLIKNHVGFYKNLSTKIQKEIQTQSDEILISSKDAAQWESTANDLKSYELELVQRIKQWERERDDQTISFTKYQERMENYDRLRQDRSLQKDRFEKELLQEQSNLKREQERQHTIAIDMEQLSVQWDQKETEQEALQTKLEILDESLQVERLRGEELRSEMRALESGQGALRAQNEAILNTMTRDQHHVQKIEQQLVKQRELRAQINADRSALVEQLKKISADLDLVQVSRMEAQTLWHQIQFQYEQALEEKELMKTDFLEKSTVALGLQKLVDSQGMLSDGSLALKEQLSRHIVGFLFEEVSLHEEDEVLLEHCLPTLFQSALVENRDHFVKIIDKAQELSVSRVSFFVTDLLEPLSPLEQQDRAHLLELAGVRCVGNRLEKLTKPFLKNIFDRIFICQDEWLLFEAKKRARKNSQFVLITERGTVHVNPFGFSYGIFLQESAEKLSFLQYRRQYTQALQEKETSQEKLAFSEGVVYNISQKKVQEEQKLSQLSQTLEKEKVELVKLAAQRDHVDLQLRHVDENIAKLEEEKQGFLGELSTLQNSFAQNQKKIEDLESDFLFLENDFDVFQTKFLTQKEERDEVFFLLQSKKSQRAVILERQKNTRQQYEEVLFHMRRMEQKERALKIQLEEVHEQVAKEEKDFLHFQDEIKNLKVLIQNLNEKLLFLNEEENQTAEKLRVLENKLKAQKNSFLFKQKFVNEKKLELARYETILETALKDAFEKYHLTLEDVPMPNPVLEDPAQQRHLELKIKELQQHLLHLGPVNERALEEFQELSERLEFLTQQKNDIESSMQELYLSIQEIEENTKIRFKEVFDKIDMEFQKLFPILFPGGQAQLHLLNEQDLLNTGVEILARLPGKKMQNLSLFSGGEKALTAISLILSLLKTTPTPFCFLDEVDAPLDEANVGRFNAVLEKLSEEFQFIIITHNRRTMEILDTIYGISMNEPGVSRLVSVDLSKVPSHLKKKQKTPLRSGAFAEI